MSYLKDLYKVREELKKVLYQKMNVGFDYRKKDIVEMIKSDEELNSLNSKYKSTGVGYSIYDWEDRFINFMFSIVRDFGLEFDKVSNVYVYRKLS